MLTFATAQRSILRSGDALCRRGSCVQWEWAALLGLTLASFGLAGAAGFDEISAFTTVRTNSSTSNVASESRLKNLALANGNAATSIRAAAAIDDADSSLCNEKKQPLCRDLAASEFQVISLRFVLPEVRGLSPKSLNIRRNSVSATYTFR